MRGHMEGRKTVFIAFVSGSPFLSMRETDAQVIKDAEPQSVMKL